MTDFKVFFLSFRCVGYAKRYLYVEKYWRSVRYIVSVTTISTKLLAPVVQTLDSAIRRINHFPADKYYGNQLRYLLDSDLSAG